MFVHEARRLTLPACLHFRAFRQSHCFLDARSASASEKQASARKRTSSSSIYGKPVDEGKPLPVSFVQAIRFIYDQEGPLRPEDPEDLPETLDRTWPEADSLEGARQIERSRLQRKIRDVALASASSSGLLGAATVPAGSVPQVHSLEKTGLAFFLCAAPYQYLSFRYEASTILRKK